MVFEESLSKRAFRKGGPSPLAESESSAPEDTALRDVADLSAEECKVVAGTSVAAILEVALKSGNLKGTFVRRLKKSPASLQKIVETLAGRTAAEELAHLSNDNARLRREVEGLKSELKAYRREFSGIRAELSAAKASPSDTFAGYWLEEIRASIVASVGTLIDARFAEECLLPTKTMGPPLAANRQQEG